MLTFGLWLKQRRKALDLTQEELALRVGCSLVLIQKIEEGERRPSKQIAGLLAQQLGVPAGEHPEFIRFARADHIEATADPDAPWRTLHHRFANLPVQPNPLFGRQSSVVEICRRLLSEKVRLLTLVGPPGIGKTRLAIEAASRLSGEFADGVYFVPLAAATQTERVVTGLAQTLGIKESGVKGLFEQVKEGLAEKRQLLVLDNLEQVVVAAPMVAELLSACPWLQILATSRVPLHIRAERQFHVTPLGVAPVSPAPDPLVIQQYPAVALFVDRAQSVDPDFKLSGENAGTIAQIVANLDGLPLAIELVAVRVGQSSPQELLNGLSDRLTLLAGGPYDLPERQQALRNAIAWSYDLLEPGERRLFYRLSVFVGGFDREMAITVGADPAIRPIAGDRPGLDVSDPLNRLVDHNLVLFQPLPGGVARFTYLETIRAYAQERLDGSGEGEEARQQMAACMLALAEKSSAALPEWADRLELEHDNFRAVIRRALAGSDTHPADAATVLRLAAGLWHFWQLRGHLSEGLATIQAALALPYATDDPSQMDYRAQVLMGGGWLLRDAGDFVQARTYFEEALAIYRQMDDPQGLAYALYSVGYIQFLVGDVAQGIQGIEEGLALYRAIGDEKSLTLTLFMLGRIAVGQGDYVKGRIYLDECLAVEQKGGDPYGLARTHGSLGELAIYQGDLTGAAAHLAESQVLLEKLGEKQLLAWVLTKRGELAWHQGCSGEARGFLERGLALAREIGYRWNEAYTLTYLGLVNLVEGHLDRAQASVEDSLAIFSELESDGDIAQTRKDLARVLLAKGEIEGAAKIYRECLPIFQQRGYMPDVVECLEGLAIIWTRQGDSRKAVRLFAAAWSQRERLGMPLPPVLREPCQRDVAALRASLGDKRFEAAWAEGSGWSLERAVQEGQIM